MTPYSTDERLKSALDTNQLARERLGRAVLALDKRFTEVRPRHPRGGPDGGRDIDAVYRGRQAASGAVGFVNQANDSAEQKRQIKAKFQDDLNAALAGTPKPSVFIFLTNVNLTLSEHAELEAFARAGGIAECEVMDRERIRIALDGVDGFATRFQYLQIPLSEPEQASFFAKWGDDIQSVVTTGFQRVETTLERLLFLHEAEDVLHTLSVQFELDRTYDAAEIGHFRCFCSGFLRELKCEIFQIMFGASDISERFRSDITSPRRQEPGIGAGIAGGAWEQQVDISKPHEAGQTPEEKYVQTNSSSSVGMKRVRTVAARYTHDDQFIRFRPRLRLKDMDEFSWVAHLNASFAKKVMAIHVYANGYKLDELHLDGLQLEEREFANSEILKFSEVELADPWVTIRPKLASLFRLSFYDQTPPRIYQTPRGKSNRPPLAEEDG